MFLQSISKNFQLFCSNNCLNFAKKNCKITSIYIFAELETFSSQSFALILKYYWNFFNKLWWKKSFYVNHSFKNSTIITIFLFFFFNFNDNGNFALVKCNEFIRHLKFHLEKFVTENRNKKFNFFFLKQNSVLTCIFSYRRFSYLNYHQHSANLSGVYLFNVTNAFFCLVFFRSYFCCKKSGIFFFWQFDGRARVSHQAKKKRKSS